MINLFHPVFFIFLGFLGILVPKLLIGISSAGITIERSKEAIKHKQTENDIKLDKEIGDLEKQLQDYKQKNIVKKSRQINKKISNLKKSKENFRRRQTMFIKRYDLLNYRDGIIYPGILILFSVIFSFLGGKCAAPVAMFTSYAFVVLFLLIAIFRILKCFNIIREANARVKDYEKERIATSFHEVFSKNDGINAP